MKFKKIITIALLGICAVNLAKVKPLSDEELKKIQTSIEEYFAKEAQKYYALAQGILDSFDNTEFANNLKKTIADHLADKSITPEEKASILRITSISRQLLEMDEEAYLKEFSEFQKERGKIFKRFYPTYSEIYKKEKIAHKKKDNKALKHLKNRLKKVRLAEESLYRDMPVGPAIKKLKELNRQLIAEQKKPAEYQEIGKKLDGYGLLQKYFALLPLNAEQRKQLNTIDSLAEQVYKLDWIQLQKEQDEYFQKTKHLWAELDMERKKLKAVIKVRRREGQSIADLKKKDREVYKGHLKKLNAVAQSKGSQLVNDLTQEINSLSTSFRQVAKDRGLQEQPLSKKQKSFFMHVLDGIENGLKKMK